MIERVFAKGNKVSGLTFLRLRLAGGANVETTNNVITHNFTASRGILRKTVDCTALFLPYMPSGINYAPGNVYDVVSGPFSGCIMAEYFNGGTRRVCHVATPECATAWTNLKANTHVAAGREFVPSDSIADPSTYGKKVKGGLYIMGIITRDGKLFTALLTQLGATDSSTYSVVDLQQI